MRLTVIGSGTAEPHSRRSGAGFWLDTSRGSVLLDCSASVPHRMAAEGLDWAGLDAIWISHFHLDHCGGLAPFLFGTRNATATRERKKPLQIFGPVGLRRLIERFDAVNEYKLFKQPFPVEVVEVTPLERFEIMPAIEAVALKTPHTDESLAIRIEDGWRSIVYTADTGFGKEIADFARGAGLLVIESSFFRDKPVDLHLELAEAMYLIRHARPRRAMLTHFYGEWDEVDLAAETARFEPSCEIVEAVDGLRLDIAE
ncbi:MAG: MBL fold metallo-hydrolase [Pyrinomonadaceae bacterium]